MAQVVTDQQEINMIIVYFIASFVIACFGSDRRIGFFLTLLACLSLSPLIGLIIMLCSETDKSYNERQEMYKYFKNKNHPL